MTETPTFILLLYPYPSFWKLYYFFSRRGDTYVLRNIFCFRKFPIENYRIKKTALELRKYSRSVQMTKYENGIKLDI